jgi:putative component of membrane protein insertase Oxa1/YidC/SpoIIIJ protein YidD
MSSVLQSTHPFYMLAPHANQTAAQMSGKVLRPTFAAEATTLQTGTLNKDTFLKGAFNPPAAKVPQTLVTEDGYFNPDAITYSPDAIYSKSGKLSIGQKICDFLIRKVYQKPTRSSVYKWFGNPCPFKNKAGKLSCSEYTLVMIHRFGVIKGIALGAWRILKCNPITVIRGHYADPQLKDACC